MVYENVGMTTSLPTKRISAISQWKTFLGVLLTRWRRKPAGIAITSLSPYVYTGTQSWYASQRDDSNEHTLLLTIEIVRPRWPTHYEDSTPVRRRQHQTAPTNCRFERLSPTTLFQLTLFWAHVKIASRVVSHRQHVLVLTTQRRIKASSTFFKTVLVVFCPTKSSSKFFSCNARLSHCARVSEATYDVASIQVVTNDPVGVFIAVLSSR